MTHIGRERIRAMLIQLGVEAAALAEGAGPLFEQAYLKNNWFTPDHVRFCLRNWSRALKADLVESWLPEPVSPERARRVGIVMAGNIPLVGLHDLLCVLAAGHIAVVKLSRDDEVLMRWATDCLLSADSGFGERIEVTSQLRDVDRVIATGSNNTSRYFEYYFRDIPHIIRKNRTGVAVLTGDEPKTELMALGEDIFRYFGLGCRNVSKLWVPMGYDFSGLFESIQSWEGLIQHHKYANNYTYHKAIYLMNGTVHLDNGFLLLKEDTGLHAPLSSLYYEQYAQIDEVVEKLHAQQDQIQCVVSTGAVLGSVMPGNSQITGLDTYADGMDTLGFLFRN